MLWHCNRKFARKSLWTQYRIKTNVCLTFVSLMLPSTENLNRGTLQWMTMTLFLFSPRNLHQVGQAAPFNFHDTEKSMAPVLVHDFSSNYYCYYLLLSVTSFSQCHQEEIPEQPEEPKEEPEEPYQSEPYRSTCAAPPRVPPAAARDKSCGRRRWSSVPNVKICAKC